MDVSEKWGDSVEKAVELALDELGAAREDVDVEILEQPSRGFFGIGSKLAFVRVTKKQKEAPKPEVKEVKEVVEISEKPTEKRPRPKKSNKERNERRSEKHRPKIEKEYKETEDEDIIPSVDIESLAPLADDHKALIFLREVVKDMGLDISVSGRSGDKDLFIYLEGKDTGTIIGKRGATLDAIQYLTSLVVNKEEEDYIRVVIDAENYRAKRERSLENLAQRLADKVVRSRRSYKLEPMNPYERKVIHSTLQKDSRVVTRSEGQDPYRRVIIELK